MYAIVDIETTGGYAARNRICEIAIILHDGSKVIEEYQSLINPERHIPPQLSAIHGIDDHMVENAPKFYEEAKKIHELLNENIFVAHSVNFDYSFVKAAFADLGFDLKCKKLCTVRLSRKIFPGLKSYSLGNICDYRGIKIHDRHRAFGDAIATAELFTQLVQYDSDNIIETSLKRNASVVNLPENLSRETYEKLPEAAGVYYFLNQKNDIIYVGKAKNIKKRVSNHFGGKKMEVAKQAFQSEIHHVDFHLTGNELVALLHESFEIRKNWPKYNRAQKNNNPGYAIFMYEDRKGYKRLQLSRKQSGMQSIIKFPNHAAGFQFLIDNSKKFKLCPKLAGIQSTPAHCFDYEIGLCEGACAEKETVQSYNKKIEEFVIFCKREKLDYVVLGEGRNNLEKSIIMVEEGHYLGYGFIDLNESIEEWDQLRHTIQKFPDHPEIHKILGSKLALNYKKIKKEEFGMKALL